MQNFRLLRVALMIACTWACGVERTPPSSSKPAAPASARIDTATEQAPSRTEPPAAPAATNTGSTQVANPASKNCIAKGGSVQIANDPRGQFGICVFSDGSRCEEWRLARGQCVPGQCRAETGICD